MAKKSRIKTRQKSAKNRVLEELRKTPIVEVACKKTGVARATYYRWLENDSKFEKDAQKALKEGEDKVNDMAVSQLIIQIQNGVLKAATYWLDRRDPKFKPKNNRYQYHVCPESRNLTKKEMELLEKAFEDVGFEPEQSDEEEK